MVRHPGKWDTPTAPLLLAKHPQIPLSAVTGTIQLQEDLAGIHAGREGEKAKKKNEKNQKQIKKWH